MKPKKMKIPATKVLSDDCAITTGQVIEDGETIDAGVQHFVHQGEWVEVMPVLTVKEVMQLSRLQNGSNDPAALGENLTVLCVELAHRIIEWNWTDLMGQPLDQPYNRPEILEGLSADELMWLVNATSGKESADERKKDSKPSVVTSLGTTTSPVTSPLG